MVALTIQWHRSPIFQTVMADHLMRLRWPSDQFFLASVVLHLIRMLPARLACKSCNNPLKNLERVQCPRHCQERVHLRLRA